MSLSHFLQLPIDILIIIIQKLCVQDVYNLILSCKTLKNLIIHNNAIWRPISRTRLIIHDYGIQKISSQCWHETCRISHNWCKGVYKNKGLVYHDVNYMPWLHLHNSEALLLSVGSDLRCYSVDRAGFPDGRRVQWNLTMPSIERYDKRTNDISRFVLKDNLLVCGNRNGSVAVYRVDNISSRPRLIQRVKDCHEHGTVEVSDVAISNRGDHSCLVTASMGSPVVLLWTWGPEDDTTDLSRGGSDLANCFGVDVGADACVGARCVSLNESGDKLAVGPDGNRRPVLIDLKVAEFMIKSEESADRKEIVQHVQWHDEHTLCYVTHAGSLQMMDIRSHQVVYNTRDPFEASFYCVKTDGKHAVVAGSSQHSRCVLYDSRRPQHTQVYFTQEKRKSSPVYSLHLESSKLVAATDRGVAALDFTVPAHRTVRRDYSHVFQTNSDNNTLQ